MRKWVVKTLKTCFNKTPLHNITKVTGFVLATG